MQEGSSEKEKLQRKKTITTVAFIWKRQPHCCVHLKVAAPLLRSFEQRSQTRNLKKRKKMYENSHRPTKGKSADSRFNTIRETPQCVPWGIPLQQVRWIIETGHHSIPAQGDSLDSANAFDWALGARYYKNLRNQKRTFMKRVRERVHSHRSALKISL